MSNLMREYHIKVAAAESEENLRVCYMDTGG